MGSDWKIVEIGEYSKVQGGFAFKGKDFIDSGVPVAKIKNVKERDIDLNDCGFVSNEIAEQNSSYFIKNGDVLISMTGSGANAPNSIVGRVARHKGFDNEFLINQRVGRFIIKDDNQIDKGFLYYYLSPKQKQWEFVAIATGSANQVNISGKQIESLFINLPELPEQKAIAHILGSLDDKIELNRQMNQTLEQMAQALFKSWFVDFDPVIDNALAAGNPIPDALQKRAEQRKELDENRKALPEALQSLFPAEFEFSDELDKWVPLGWKAGTLNDLAKFSNGKTSPQRESGNIPVFGSNGIIGVSTEFNRKDIIVVGRVGTYCGSLHYFSEKCWVTDNAMSAEMKNKTLNTFLFEFLKTANLNDKRTGSGQPLLNQGIMKSIETVIPEQKVISDFSQLANDFYKKIRENEVEIQSLTKLRDTLLPKLVSGEVRVP